MGVIVWLYVCCVCGAGSGNPRMVARPQHARRGIQQLHHQAGVHQG